ncbi:unnamed protein product [Arabis nemorensis]|uniref:Uncharacterized protein n=1 Tax=Arabis nemorensis TaxID=586526 RepID=A0A565CK28_9BRAS|nr:unnamed protein product [Arabis nemorensis]
MLVLYGKYRQTAIKMLRNRTYFSWRIISPSLLSYVMEQDKYICRAVAIIRQLEALFRKAGLSVDLSIQEFVNLVPARYKEEDMNGGIVEIEEALEYLKSDGTVEAALRPITGTINQRLSYSEISF